MMVSRHDEAWAPEIGLAKSRRKNGPIGQNHPKGSGPKLAEMSSSDVVTPLAQTPVSRSEKAAPGVPGGKESCYPVYARFT